MSIIAWCFSARAILSYGKKIAHVTMISWFPDSTLGTNRFNEIWNMKVVPINNFLELLADYHETCHMNILPLETVPNQYFLNFVLLEIND
jgi:hypothetical protein